MNIKQWLDWLREYVHSYNLFMPNEDDYEDDNDQTRDPTIIVKHQQYTTRLYVPLVISKYKKVVVVNDA